MFKRIHYEIYNKLGAHPMVVDGISGVHFGIWAPNGRRVSVLRDFNGWDGRVHPMRVIGDSGIFELFIPGYGKITKKNTAILLVWFTSEGNITTSSPLTF